LALRPKDPQLVIEQLLLMLWPLAASRHIDRYEFIDFSESLLPDGLGSALAAKFYFFGFEDYFYDTDAYLEFLEEEFPDPADRATAASMVLSESVEWVVQRGLEMKADDLVPDGPTHRLGVESSHPECILLEMICKALELDPQNLQARILLAQLPRASRQAKKLVETGLQTMVDTIADDPQPCMALAKLYSEKSAFRKVETCLRQAEQRAPHDEQVKEFHILTLLKTIDINLRRKKYHLVKTDLEKAEMRCNQKTLAPLTARRILFDLAYIGQLSLFDGQLQTGNKGRIQSIMQQYLTGLSESDLVKTLGVLAMNREQYPEDWGNEKSSVLDTWFKRQGKIVNRLPSKAIRNVLLPEMDKLALARGRPAWLVLFLNRYKTILKRMDDEDILPVLDVLIEAGRADKCLSEIRRRIKTASGPFLLLLEFYQMVVPCIIDNTPPDAEAFSALISRVPPQHLNIFQRAARRLSKWTSGSLREALEHFNFDLLEDRCNGPECAGRSNEGDLDDSGMDLPDFLDAEMIDPIHSVLEMVEALIDMGDMRGAHEKVIKKHRKALMGDHKAKAMLKEVAEMLPPFRIDELSPEARILIYG
jgi:hypothetical protein